MYWAQYILRLCLHLTASGQHGAQNHLSTIPTLSLSHYYIPGYLVLRTRQDVVQVSSFFFKMVEIVYENFPITAGINDV